MYHNFLIHSSVEQLCCFHVLAVVNSAVMNIEVHMSLSILVSSVCMPSSGIAGSYGSSAWRAAIHGVAKSRTRLSDFTFTFHFHALEKEMATQSSVLA